VDVQRDPRRAEAADRLKAQRGRPLAEPGGRCRRGAQVGLGIHLIGDAQQLPRAVEGGQEAAQVIKRHPGPPGR
jgi:hypothetical protein